jgi:integrase/recombinase XerD
VADRPREPGVAPRSITVDTAFSISTRALAAEPRWRSRSRGARAFGCRSHVSTTHALSQYAAARDRCVPRLYTSAFFVSEHGSRLTGDGVRHTFALVGQRIGLRASTPGRRHGRGPRLHDLRHRFAATTLIGWYRAGRDVERELAKLATYLGHVHVNDTYWYLEAVHELLQLAAARLETAVGEGAR